MSTADRDDREAHSHRHGWPRLGPNGRELAHPGLRAAAFWIDGAVTVTLTAVVVYSSLIFGPTSVGVIAFAGVPVIAAVAATVATATHGVTLGKRLLGLQVVDAETGSMIGLRSVVRSLVIVTPLLVTCGVQAWTLDPLHVDTATLLVGWILPPSLWVALFAIVPLSPRFRGLEDLAAHSVVVRTSASSPGDRGVGEEDPR